MCRTLPIRKGRDCEADSRVDRRWRVLGYVFACPGAGAESEQEGDLYDCEDFRYQEDAQKVFDRHPGDPYGLDGPIGPASEGPPPKEGRAWPARTSRTALRLPTTNTRPGRP
jgi:hypothetical protein